MTIDLSKLKVGDSVKLRCGGVIEVGSDFYFGSDIVVIDGGVWNIDGKFLSNLTCQLDIIEVIPKPEPVVRHVWLAYDNELEKDSVALYWKNPPELPWVNKYKITITDGNPSIEKVTA